MGIRDELDRQTVKSRTFIVFLYRHQEAGSIYRVWQEVHPQVTIIAEETYTCENQHDIVDSRNRSVSSLSSTKKRSST